MGEFQKIVLVLAVVILILTLLVISSVLLYGKTSGWPPSISSCPDWWVKDGLSGGCKNVKDLGICPKEDGHDHLVMNFLKPAFTGSEGSCNKYNWATKCKITWDGITYGANNPCDTDT
jgi:hypothetical protein